MASPSFVIGRDEQDTAGTLLPEHAAAVEEVLRAGGFVLLASDTAYAVATWLRSAQTRAQIDELLQRSANEPISLAFPSPEAVWRSTVKNEIADALLDSFTPGPITVVCTASRKVPIAFTRDVMGSLNHTIGVRIPDSAVEQQVAVLGSSPTTTAPVRGAQDTGTGKKLPVGSFDEALTLVQDRSAAFGDAPWCAIEGDFSRDDTSTVVQVLGSSNLCKILRPGAIPDDVIRDVVERAGGSVDKLAT